MRKLASMFLPWAMGFSSPTLAQTQVVFDSLAGGSTVGGVLYSHDPGELSSTAENTSLPPNGSESISQIAQRLNLTGTSRHLTRLDLRFGSIGANHPVSYDDIIRIYDVAPSGLPGNLLYSATVTGITFPAGASANRVATATLFPNIDLPGSIFLSSAEDNIVYGALNPPSFFGIAWRGSGGPFTGTTGLYATQDTATGVWSREPSYDSFPTSVIEARFSAVPTPSAAIILLAAIPLSRPQRRRRFSN